MQLMGTPPIQMANLGMADSLILMVMALVVFGPRRLPQIGRQIGKLMYEFRKASNDFKFQMEEELRSSEEAERRKKEEERQNAMALAAPALPVPVDAPIDPAALGSSSLEAVYTPSTPSIPEPPADETYPRIQPPTTGEQVAAARPNSLTALVQTALVQAAKDSGDTTTAADPESGPAEAMVSEGAPAEPGASEPEHSVAQSEQAAHHA